MKVTWVKRDYIEHDSGHTNKICLNTYRSEIQSITNYFNTRGFTFFFVFF